MAGAGPARRGSDLTALAHRRRLVGLIPPSCAVVGRGLFESLVPPEVGFWHNFCGDSSMLSASGRWATRTCKSERRPDVAPSAQGMRGAAYATGAGIVGLLFWTIQRGL